MPPRLPTASIPTRCARRRPIELYFCPSCSLWRFARPTAERLLLRQRLQQQPRSANLLRLPTAGRRCFSAIAPATSINVPVEIPERNRELYKALSDLKSSAGAYVNLSRLNLALRGLESEDAVVRIAVLSMGEQGLAKKLAKVLLADPLSDEGAWEKELEDATLDDGRALLLRYGEESEESSYNPLLRTLSIPSRVLQKHKLEILVTTLNVGVTGSNKPSSLDRPQDAILVPALQTPTSFSGRHTIVTYPVHKAIVTGKGLESAVAYGRFTAGETESSLPERTVKVAIGVPAKITDLKDLQSESVAVVDVDLASESLEKIRESIANAVVYERGWFKSGMSPLSDWLVNGTTKETTGFKPAIQDLVTSTIDEADANVLAEETSRLNELVTRTVPESTRTSISSSIGIWAEHGHRELRDQLDATFAGKNWRKLGWWKLFWRVDDVAMVSADVLERRWLVEAEKNLIFIAGRVEEAGFVTDAQSTSDKTILKAPEEERKEVYGKLPEYTTVGDVAQLEADAQKDDSKVTVEPKPWPSYIPATRARLLNETVPPLQALAQTLVVQTLSTSFLTSALSGLIYLSVSTTSVLEAGAVAALGTVWSMRRMQRKWETARSFWEGEVREEGRKALKDTEEKVRLIVNEGVKPKENLDAAEERKIARTALGRVRRLLENMSKAGKI